MAIGDRDPTYTTETERTVYTRESSSTGWFVGIIVALALLAIAYLVFSANNNGGSAVSTTGTTNTPAVTAPADSRALPTTTAPAVTAPADTVAAPATTAPAAAPAAQ